MEVLLSEVEAHKNVLFGTLSYDISSKRKRSWWESLSEALGSEKCTQAEVKKKWSDIKVDVKWRLAAHRRSVAKTGGGTGEEGPTLMNRESAQLWVTLLSRVVGVGVWVTLITPKVNTCICVTHSKRVHTVTYSAEVRRGKGELIKTFHT